MKRYCFQMSVRPGRVEEYRLRHQQVWPEMLQALKQTGWHNYSLFLGPDRNVIGYVEAEDLSESLTRMACLPVDEAWQSGMAELLDGSVSDPAIGNLLYLEEIFNLEEQLLRRNRSGLHHAGEE